MSRVFKRTDFKWKENDLIYEIKIAGVAPAEDNLWKVVYPDGVLSADRYNKTRAKEHALKIARKELEIQIEDEDLK